jgi:hypothetical protein
MCRVWIAIVQEIMTQQKVSDTTVNFFGMLIFTFKTFVEAVLAMAVTHCQQRCQVPLPRTTAWPTLSP